MLSQEQNDAVEILFSNIKSKQVQTLGGYAGTGKTTVIKSIVQKLIDSGLRPAICAYTGKAVNVLRNKFLESQTLHSLLYTPEIDQNGDICGWTLVNKFKINSYYDIILVDEASMVDQTIYRDLINTDLPVIFVGDHGQLEPISNTDNFNLMRNPDVKLEKIHRNSGEIAHFAEFVRKGNLPCRFPSSNRVQLVKSSAVQPHHYSDYDQVICVYNKSRVRINNIVREHRNINLSYIAIGEKIICLKNNHLAGLFNGMQGTITKVLKNDKLSFVSNGILYSNIKYDPDQFGQEKADFKKDRSSKANLFDYAYAITCHKAQGDEWDDIIVYEENNEFCDPLRWRYTAASRAKNSIIWVPTII